MKRMTATVFLPLLVGTIFASLAHATCPFGSDCKPQPCGVASETTAVSGYAPRFTPAYVSASAAANAYQGSSNAASFSAGNTYSHPPCDPTVVPKKDKALIVPIPAAEPDSTDEEEAAAAQSS